MTAVPALRRNYRGNNSQNYQASSVFGLGLMSSEEWVISTMFWDLEITS
jgi:hypothetical protein